MATAHISEPPPEAQNEGYEVFVMKQDFKFHCAHFVAFQGYRERLHGHNYTVGVRMMGNKRGPDGYLIDFGDIKRVTRALCKELNEHFICPMHSDVIEITVDDDQVELRCQDGAFFSFPKGDCALLPIVHSTAEELAQYLWRKIVHTFSPECLIARGIHTLELTVAEAPQQDGTYRRKISSEVCAHGDGAHTHVVADSLKPSPCLGRESRSL